jgi:hypothetical protein
MPSCPLCFMSGSLQGFGAGRSTARKSHRQSPVEATGAAHRSAAAHRPTSTRPAPKPRRYHQQAATSTELFILYVHSRATMADEGAPRSIAQLADEAAATIHFSNRFSCRAWLRSCDALTDQALQAHQRGEVERAFICWARAAT